MDSFQVVMSLARRAERRFGRRTWVELDWPKYSELVVRRIGPHLSAYREFSPVDDEAAATWRELTDPARVANGNQFIADVLMFWLRDGKRGVTIYHTPDGWYHLKYADSIVPDGPYSTFGIVRAVERDPELLPMLKDAVKVYYEAADKSPDGRWWKFQFSRPRRKKR